MERRKNSRTAVELAAVIHTPTGNRSRGLIANLSRTGCLLRLPRDLNGASYLQLTIPLPDLQVCTAGAAVRWSGGSQAGIEFVLMPRADEAALRRLLMLMAGATR